MISNRYSTVSVLLAGLLAAAGVHAQNTSAAATTDVPAKAGEASTTVQGRPNALPRDPAQTSKTKEERRAEKELKKAKADSDRALSVMGQKGASAGAPAGTPATAPVGTPPVQAGGTAK